MTDLFGDITIDDVWDLEPPAPEQVARRLHELRRFLGAYAGEQLEPFDDLPEADSVFAVALAVLVVEWIADHPRTPLVQDTLFPEALHNRLRIFAPDTIAAWDDLSEDEQLIGEAIADDVAEWLGREGSWR